MIGIVHALGEDIFMQTVKCKIFSELSLCFSFEFLMLIFVEKKLCEIGMRQYKVLVLQIANKIFLVIYIFLDFNNDNNHDDA